MGDIKGKLLNIDKGFCQPASMNENNHRYYFEISAYFDGGEILKDLDTDIYLLQDIWVPLVAKKKIFEYLTSSLLEGRGRGGHEKRSDADHMLSVAQLNQ